MINQIVNDRSRLTKQQRINLANQHHQEMLNKYPEQINEYIKNMHIDVLSYINELTIKR